MNKEGGTKSNFSPFLIFFKATRPLSPTSTFWMLIFWGGRPESVSHFCRAEAFSKESMSQPQGIFWVTVALVLSVVEIEHWIGCLRKFSGCDWNVWLFWCGQKLGMRVVCKILEASAMAIQGHQVNEGTLSEAVYMVSVVVIFTVMKRAVGTSVKNEFAPKRQRMD